MHKKRYDHQVGLVDWENSEERQVRTGLMAHGIAVSVQLDKSGLT